MQRGLPQAVHGSCGSLYPTASPFAAEYPSYGLKAYVHSNNLAQQLQPEKTPCRKSFAGLCIDS